MGKSRLVEETGKLFMIPINLQEELPPNIATYPPPDDEVQGYFSYHEAKSNEVLQTEFAISIAVIFNTVAPLAKKTRNRMGQVP
ncbi:unnamed protein product [Rhizoctonia solani]|uniref:Uncharacterized protein n=1 Tax=Rhizoctonia solani TaxID=456999 RepID=A0A8H2XJR6_9AGAM|nr:unnamed protein product [Rhizoctonia solani]